MQKRTISPDEREKVKDCIRLFYDAMREHGISRVVAAVAIQIMQSEIRRHGIVAFVALPDTKDETDGAEKKESVRTGLKPV